MVKLREFSIFTVVGTAATGLHMGVVATSVPFGLSPLVANAVGFVFSFTLGFIGHARWSFPAAGRPVAPALTRFATLSVLGFGLNEAAYAGVLRWTPFDYRIALLFIITTLGLVKLLASKHWAFAHS